MARVVKCKSCGRHFPISIHVAANERGSEIYERCPFCRSTARYDAREYRMPTRARTTPSRCR
jgi:hypothetical protein